MRYFRIVVVAAAAAVTLTILACCTGIRSIRTAFSYGIMPLCRQLLCFIVFMNENE